MTMFLELFNFTRSSDQRLWSIEASDQSYTMDSNLKLLANNFIVLTDTYWRSFVYNTNNIEL